MVKPVKVEAVQSLKEKFEKANIFVLTDFRGLTVQEISDLRGELRPKSVEYRVVKNRLAKIALAESGSESVDDLMVGPTAVAFGYEDPVECVKVLVDFQKKQEKLQLKGGIMSGTRLDPAKLQELAKMPSQGELYARMIGSIQSPLMKTVWGLKSASTQLVWAIKAVADKKES
jgi:large subunit ribosomal protein L10